jgi:hypothetical protein
MGVFVGRWRVGVENLRWPRASDELSESIFILEDCFGKHPDRGVFEKRPETTERA